MIKYRKAQQGIKFPFSTVDPNTVNAVQNEFNNSVENPQSATERYDKNFKPATGEVEFDPASQLMVGNVASEGVNLLGHGIKKAAQMYGKHKAEKAANDLIWKKLSLSSDMSNAYAPLVNQGAMSRGVADELILKTVATMKKQGGILYKKGGRIKKAQSGRVAPEITPEYNEIQTHDYFPKSLGEAQPVVGVDENDPSRFITQGPNYLNARRINSKLPGYAGNVTNVTRDEFNAYNTAMKNWQENSNYDADGKEFYTNGIDPWADYNKKYGENTLLRTDDIFRKDATSAFDDQDLSAIDHVKGSFTNPSWDSGSHVANSTPYSEYNGISSYYRNRGIVDDGTSTPTTETPTVTPESTSNPPTAKVAAPVKRSPAYYSNRASQGSGKPMTVSKRKTREQKASKKKWKKKGGLLY